MPSQIIYHWGKDHLLIDLGRRVEPRIRVLFWAEMLLTSGMASILLMQSLSEGPDALLFWLFGMGAGILYGLAAFRFLSRCLYRELLLLDANTLALLQKGFLTRRLRRFSWADAGPLHYRTPEAKTDHPLKGRLYDYWGFDTHERLVQQLHQEGNLAFASRVGEIRFGRGLYLWHAEELVQMMKLYAGGAMQLGREWAHILQNSGEEN